MNFRKMTRFRFRYLLWLLLPLGFQLILAPLAGAWNQNTVLLDEEAVEAKTIQTYITEVRPSLPPEAVQNLTQVILQESRRLELDSCTFRCSDTEKVALLTGIIHLESEFKSTARSPKDARGFMQVMPATANWLSQREGWKLNRDDLNKPEVNIHLGVSYLNYLLDLRKGDTEKALLSYNAGPGAVDRWGGNPKYNRIVFENKDRYLELREKIADSTR
ncbi:lytic transglycosylase domain-containing protein [Leptospira gomenensis]|uniref:Lytic transglycosylase domain-containing protein n=1 Tax=Leptospira gomenensis TaxID=2484974 RepID=A0A5F1Z276_9LEPT|nr:lytic transglycosylase domain-containing protein [Leptospira gomenensis]TGK29076.1 lytic transglycosylase domain-containing protein [Leptospira gomenensis]TGK41940.1 lytic transglycosylase domain-containing protein [Leptospira gomenensis]TGK45044.1 lytic transglycosylase domain-containing protein [Leptospira gomenensis]TGK67370.1 lytic transglycosylase domain-containing protein [Leptospira gomenensis]